MQWQSTPCLPLVPGDAWMCCEYPVLHMFPVAYVFVLLSRALNSSLLPLQNQTKMSLPLKNHRQLNRTQKPLSLQPNSRQGPAKPPKRWQRRKHHPLLHHWASSFGKRYVWISELVHPATPPSHSVKSYSKALKSAKLSRSPTLNAREA